LPHEAVGVSVVDDKRHRAGPAAACEPLGQRAHVRHVIAGLFGALDGERQRVIRPAALDRGQALNGSRVHGASGESIDSFRGKSDDFTFYQGLHRLMYYVAQIVGMTEIDHNGWHGIIRSAARNTGKT
jgi:hypothetical protein